jgi:hypothetical protein
MYKTSLGLGHTTDIPIAFIKNPDPSINATASTNPIPAAKARDVDTAGRYFLVSLALEISSSNEVTTKQSINATTTTTTAKPLIPNKLGSAKQSMNAHKQIRICKFHTF